MTKKTRRIAIATGGTGGHIFPAKSLSVELKKRGHEVIFMTDTRSFSYLSEEENIMTIPSASPSGGLFKKCIALWTMPYGVLVAMIQLVKWRADVVVGFGGYPSFPTLIAAVLLRKKTMIHEQNAVLGRVNRALVRWVKCVALSFEKTKGMSDAYSYKTLLTGNPVREAIRKIYKVPYPKITEKEPFHLLVLGGSQGASSLSQIVPEAICALPEKDRKRISITQQCRKEDIGSVEERYTQHQVKHHLATFFEDVPEHLTRSHLLISRAGASTLAEITVAGRPSILFPYPYAMDDHQTANAICLADNQAAIVIPEHDIRPAEVTETLKEFLSNPEKLTDMAIHAFEMGIVDADKRLADVVEALYK